MYWAFFKYFQETFLFTLLIDLLINYLENITQVNDVQQFYLTANDKLRLCFKNLAHNVIPRWSDNRPDMIC